MHLVKGWRFLVGNGEVVDVKREKQRRVVNIAAQVEYEFMSAPTAIRTSLMMGSRCGRKGTRY